MRNSSGQGWTIYLKRRITEDKLLQMLCKRTVIIITNPQRQMTNRRMNDDNDDCNNKLCGRPPQYAPAPCKLTFDLLTLKAVSESRDVSYLCANFSLPRPLCSRLRPDVRDRQRDRQTDVRRASSLNAPAVGAGHNKTMFRKITEN